MQYSTVQYSTLQYSASGTQVIDKNQRIKTSVLYLSAAITLSGTSLEFIPMGLLAAMCMAISLAAASDPVYSTITPVKITETECQNNGNKSANIRIIRSNSQIQR